MPIAYRLDEDEEHGPLRDTVECERIAELACAADILIYDCLQAESQRVAMGYQNPHPSPVTVARIARRVGVKKAVILHFGLKPEPPEILATFEQYIKRHYAGFVLVPKALDEIEISLSCR